MDVEETAFYRAVEDHFAALRGTTFIFSPKDFALLRGWFAEGVPLGAVLAGIDEVFERRRFEDGDPVSSLTYCRHAVVRHAKRLAAVHVGGGGERDQFEVAPALASLSAAIRAAAGRWSIAPAVESLLLDLAGAIATLPSQSDPGALEQTLTALEQGLVRAAPLALPASKRKTLDERVSAGLAGMPGDDEVRARSERALVLKELRLILGVPRLALVGDAT